MADAKRLVRRRKTAKDLGQDERARSLAGVYLNQAAEQLRMSGSAEALYAPSHREAKSPTKLQEALAVGTAKQKQLDACRSSVLFSALAAEAYVNEFLAVYLKGEDFKAVEKMSTVNKYVVGTRTAVGKPLFHRGHEPLQTIDTLFQLRNKLVHPKPGYGPPTYMEVFSHHDPEYNQAKAAKYVLRVANAAIVLVGQAFPDELDVPAYMLWRGRDAVIEQVEKMASTLPDRKAAPIDDLVSVAIRSGADSREPKPEN